MDRCFVVIGRQVIPQSFPAAAKNRPCRLPIDLVQCPPHSFAAFPHPIGGFLLAITGQASKVSRRILIYSSDINTLVATMTARRQYKHINNSWSVTHYHAYNYQYRSQYSRTNIATTPLLMIPPQHSGISSTMYARCIRHTRITISTLWCPLLPHGYSYKASCARPG